MKRFDMLQRAGLGVALLGLLAAAPAVGQEQANEGISGSMKGKNIATVVSETLSYWTPERMRQAKPLDVISVDPAKVAPMNAEERPPLGEPGVMPGWDPQSGLPQPKPGTIIKLNKVQPQYSVPPGTPPSSSTDYANYGPFQRWTHFGNYLTYPRSVIGKLFFKQNGNSYVCSATVVQKSTIFTAGHCVSDGQGNWSTNLLFCPSYYKGSGSGAPHPQRGCWSWTGTAYTPTDWHMYKRIDRDYACVVLSPTGTVHNTKIGNITGWAGMTWNWATRYLVMALGYPAGAPFPGYHIIHVAGVEWYERDLSSNDGGVVSKYMGNDMTGGSSGGPWFINWEHRSAAYDRLDSTGLTDPPAGASASNMPFLNGVNSHRLRGYVNEMGSPQFTNSDNDPRDVVDVFNACLSNGGN